MTFQKFIFISLYLLSITVLVFAEGAVSAAVACDYYASPSGGGSGSSISQPFRISNFWSVARPGKTLCLLDGVYTDSGSMIQPPEYLSGTADQRITIKALNDGMVRINGGGVRQPVVLKNNDYFILEGFNAHRSSGTVVQLGTGADNNIVRRVCAWDGPEDDQGGPFGNHKNKGNLIEDSCGFGVGRKIVNNGQDGNNLTVRRFWGRWERSIRIGPKMTFSLVYNSYNAIYENVIGTWDESPMGGTPVNQPYGILGMDRLDGPNFCANAKYLGSIAYIRGSDKAQSMIGLVRSSNDTHCLTFQDVVAYIEPGTHQNIKPFSLLKDPAPSSTGKLVTRTTAIGGNPSTLDGQWVVSGRVAVSSLTAAPTIWNGSDSNGAKVCKRYVNGILTSQPLWPWPMNQRIIDAMRAAGKTPVDVTRTMEEIFGAIPSECRTSSTTGVVSSITVPASPANLELQQQ